MNTEKRDEALRNLIRILDEEMAANNRWIAIHDWVLEAIPFVCVLLVLWLLVA